MSPNICVKEANLRFRWDDDRIARKWLDPLVILALPWECALVPFQIYLCGAFKNNLGWPKSFMPIKQINQPSEQEKSPDVEAEPTINERLQQRREGFSGSGAAPTLRSQRFVIHLNPLYPQKQRRETRKWARVKKIKKKRKSPERT